MELVRIFKAINFLVHSGRNLCSRVRV